MHQTPEFDNEIATAYLARFPESQVAHPPIFLVFSAIPGSGKTILARKLAEDLHAQYINHDEIRTFIRREKNIDPETIFIPPISRIIINTLVARDQNKFIILDVSIDRSWDIFFDHVKELHGIPVIIRLQLPDDVIKSRLRIRDGDNHYLINQFERFKKEFDNCSQHVKADITLGETYDYNQVLAIINGLITSN